MSASRWQPGSKDKTILFHRLLLDNVRLRRLLSQLQKRKNNQKKRCFCIVVLTNVSISLSDCLQDVLQALNGVAAAEFEFLRLRWMSQQRDIKMHNGPFYNLHPTLYRQAQENKSFIQPSDPQTPRQTIRLVRFDCFHRCYVRGAFCVVLVLK